MKGRKLYCLTLSTFHYRDIDMYVLTNHVECKWFNSLHNSCLTCNYYCDVLCTISQFVVCIYVCSLIKMITTFVFQHNYSD